MNLLRTTLASSTVAVLALAATAPAFAQLEEIIVSARKVDENLMQVPLAITAFNANDIEQMGFKQATDLALMTPSFTMVNQNGSSGRNDRSGAAMTFRGLFLGGAGGTMFIDGAPINGTQAPSFSDVERVEVLKGPQSVYFGRSTFAGAINFVMRDPSDTFKGRVAAEYGSFGNNDESLSIEGPLVEDKLSARLSVRYYYRGGQYTNAANTSEKLGSQSTKSASISTVWKPSDSLKVKVNSTYFIDSDGSPAQGVLEADNFNCKPATGAAANTRPGAGYICGELPTMSQMPANVISADAVLTPYIQTRMYNTVPSRWLINDPNFIKHFGLERQAFQIDIRADWEFGAGYTLSSLTAYHTNKTGVILDSTYRSEGDRPNLLYNVPGVAGQVETSATFPTNFTYMRMTQGFTRDWSQELRVATPQTWRLRGTAGATYLRTSSPGGSVYGVDPRGLAFAGSITRSRPVTYAVFGGLYFDILENVTLSAEARRQWDKTKTIPVVGTTGQYVVGAAGRPNPLMFKSFTPRVSLDWKFAPNSTLYGLWSRGYRPGGVNTTLLNSDQTTLDQVKAVAPNAGVTFGPERLENFEAGVKHTFLDNRARIALSAFYLKYLDGQATASIGVRSGTTTNIVSVTINSATAILKGYELEGEFQATDQLKLSGNMALNDSKISTSNLAIYSCTDCLQILNNSKAGLGNRMPAVPKWTWAASANWTDRLTENWDWTARMDYSHRGMNFVDYTATSWIGASDNINVSLGVKNDRLSISAFVNNLTQNDKLAAAIGGSFDVYNFAYSTAPTLIPQVNAIRISFPLKRVFGIRGSYTF